MRCRSPSHPGTSGEMLDGFEDVLLEDLNGLDPAFDRWLEDERGRFRAHSAAPSAKAFWPNATIRSPRSKRRNSCWPSTAGMKGPGAPSCAATPNAATSGRRMAAYDRCRGVLAEAADARPSPETEDLIGRIRAQSAVRRGWPAVRAAGCPACPAEPQAAYAPRPVADRAATRATLRLRVVPLRTIGAGSRRRARDRPGRGNLRRPVAVSLDFLPAGDALAVRIAGHWRRCICRTGDAAWSGAGGGSDPGRHDPARARAGADHRAPGRHARRRRDRLGRPLRPRR